MMKNLPEVVGSAEPAERGHHNSHDHHPQAETYLNQFKIILKN
jgi:hypothetical protein